MLFPIGRQLSCFLWYMRCCATSSIFPSESVRSSWTVAHSSISARIRWLIVWSYLYSFFTTFTLSNTISAMSVTSSITNKTSLSIVLSGLAARRRTYSIEQIYFIFSCQSALFHFGSWISSMRISTIFIGALFKYDIYLGLVIVLCSYCSS
jgi:hypothetical protein